MDSYASVFQAIGLDAKTIENTIKSKKKAGRHLHKEPLYLIADLLETVKEAGVMEGCDRTIGNLL
jgi:hypothetical protein